MTNLPDVRAYAPRRAPNSQANTGRALDRERGYPTESSLRLLTKAGYLAALIPEEYGGSGLTLGAAGSDSGGGARLGRQRSVSCHAQMYIMGTILRHGSAAQKERYLPLIASGELRLQAFGVTEPDVGHRHAFAAHHGAAGGQ